MEIQLKDLIEKVKTEGIKEGKQQAEEIKQAAQDEASEMVKEAEKKAQSIIDTARKEAEKLQIEAEDSIKIALRDLTLKFQNQIRLLFDGLILKEVKSALSSEFLKTTVVELINDWKKDEDKDMDLKLPKDDLTKLAGFFQEKLSDHLKKGLTITPDSLVDKGFVISLRDGAIKYDFSARTITEIISSNLEVEIAKLLEQANSED